MTRRNRVPKLQDLCRRHFGLTIYDIQELIDEPDNRVPYYHQVDPRAIESYLFEPNVPIFCVGFKKLVLTHEDYREQYRYNVESVAEDTREYQLHLQGPIDIIEIFHGTYSESDHLREVRLGYDRWWLGYQKTYQRLDDILLATYIYPRGLPGGEKGVTWHARKSPSTIISQRRGPSYVCVHSYLRLLSQISKTLRAWSKGTEYFVTLRTNCSTSVHTQVQTTKVLFTEHWHTGLPNLTIGIFWTNTLFQNTAARTFTLS